MTAKPEIAQRLTAAEAAERGLVGPGEAWDEERQRAVPRGQVMLAEAVERPVDLERQLQAFERNRQAILKFVAEQLVEAEYDKDKRPIQGRLHDYYVVPGSTTKALTKRGAENVAQLARWAKGGTKLVEKTATPEYADATVEVTLLDPFRRPVGSAVASCSSAEAGFQVLNTRRKYGAKFKKQKDEWTEVSPPDYRAALNDLVAKAGKRAFVQAVIVAGALDEIFHVADEERARAKSGQQDEEESRKHPVAALTVNTRTYPKGTKLAQIPVEDLTKIRDWCAEQQKHPALVESINLELDERRTTDDDTPPV